MNSLFNSLKTSLSKNIGPNPSQPSDDSTASLPTAPSQIDDNSILAPNRISISTADNNEKQQENSVRPAELANKFFGMAVKASTKLQQKAANLSTITLIGNIEKERLKFIGELQKEKGPKEAGAMSLLLSNPEAQKHIISISAEAKNFTEEPPLTFDLESDIEEIKTCANELFTLDPRLKEIRFTLVPKQVAEKKFWRNYAYKLSLVKKVLDQNQKPITPREEMTRSTNDEEMGNVNTERKESTEDEQEALEKELLNDLDDYEVVNGGAKKEDDKLDEELNKEIDALLEDDNSK